MTCSCSYIYINLIVRVVSYGRKIEIETIECARLLGTVWRYGLWTVDCGHNMILYAADEVCRR